MRFQNALWSPDRATLIDMIEDVPDGVDLMPAVSDRICFRSLRPQSPRRRKSVIARDSRSVFLRDSDQFARLPIDEPREEMKVPRSNCDRDDFNAMSFE